MLTSIGLKNFTVKSLHTLIPLAAVISIVVGTTSALNLYKFE